MPPMTMKEAAKAALQVQDAVNLSGVVHEWDRVCTLALWPEARRLNKGTDWVNTHPICTLFVDKLTHMNLNYGNKVFAALEEVKNLAK